MKRLLLVGVMGVVLVGCNQSEVVARLKNKIKVLEKEALSLDEKAKAPALECNKLSDSYAKLSDKTSPEALSAKELAIIACEKAFSYQNKALKIREEILNINFQMIIEDSK